MKKSTIVTVVLVLVLAVVLFLFAKNIRSGNGLLISPGVEKTVSQPTSSPVVNTYNPPKEIKYGSSTDLQKELDSINPQVLDSDFE